MKKVFLMVVFVAQFGFGQEAEFTFDNQKGMTDYVVGTVENKSASEIYKKVIEWIKVTYKNPDKVILSTIENEYVRFEGVSSLLYCINSLGMKNCYTTKYQIEISVKDGKYKFDLLSMEYYISPSQYSSGGWNDEAIFNKSSTPEQLTGVFKKDGSLRAIFKHVQEIPLYFNNLNQSILEYIKAESPAKREW
ncbi:DUF4468 domain-containing protein [Flavobacterium myungsuense]|uniref:DUF4468 domain-containing protein n=1 Tax=Flavobacterium myungsuense TaxID=651823 RepID=A0ABW3J1W2_9FLAO